jgi:hypothetical protein
MDTKASVVILDNSSTSKILITAIY